LKNKAVSISKESLKIGFFLFLMIAILGSGNRTVMSNGVVRYKGDVLMFMPYGHGAFFHDDGIKMVEGQFRFGKMIYGTHYREDGSKWYEGEYKDNSWNGFGKSYYNDGITVCYVGEFKEGWYHGEGIMYREDGSIWYEGGWAENTRHGEGTSYNRDGTIFFEGEWEYGSPIRKN
jgi:antitoxin component YwqK of YwqJK toxin-antitoxin module